MCRILQAKREVKRTLCQQNFLSLVVQQDCHQKRVADSEEYALELVHALELAIVRNTKTKTEQRR